VAIGPDRRGVGVAGPAVGTAAAGVKAYRHCQRNRRRPRHAGREDAVMSTLVTAAAHELGATFGQRRRYRYTLRRRWAAGQVVCWVMLNPSTADERQDDPTIRRCIGFSRTWGYAGLVVVNLFALRSTDPAALWVPATAPVGAENDAAIRDAATGACLVVAAWGVQPHHRFRDRALAVEAVLRASGAPLWCLGLTQAGHPRHPLFVRGQTKAVAYRPAYNGV
jgi:hypothetical protein